MEEQLKQIVGRFAVAGRVTDIRPLGNGLINDTFRVFTDGPDDYVLQRINQSIFQDVDLLQHNIDCVTRHIRQKLVAAGEADIDRKVLRFLPERTTGKSFWTDGTQWWRLSVFIRDALTFEAVTPEYAGYAGVAFGQFEAMLADLPDTLGEPIPDFHNMELRARQLHEAVAADAAGRLADPAVRALVDEVFAREAEMCKAERLFREGVLPKRICHCDTKVNNMLFDRDGSILCVIDLDTVMPSFVFSDFGDFLQLWIFCKDFLKLHFTACGHSAISVFSKEFFLKVAFDVVLIFIQCTNHYCLVCITFPSTIIVLCMTCEGLSPNLHFTIVCEPTSISC
jgi:hypothetical protein